jgi:hypothetical protein
MPKVTFRLSERQHQTILAEVDQYKRVIKLQSAKIKGFEMENAFYEQTLNDLKKRSFWQRVFNK